MMSRPTRFWTSTTTPCRGVLPGHLAQRTDQGDAEEGRKSPSAGTPRPKRSLLCFRSLLRLDHVTAQASETASTRVAARGFDVEHVTVEDHHPGEEDAARDDQPEDDEVGNQASPGATRTNSAHRQPDQRDDRDRQLEAAEVERALPCARAVLRTTR